MQAATRARAAATRRRRRACPRGGALPRSRTPARAQRSRLRPKAARTPVVAKSLGGCDSNSTASAAGGGALRAPAWRSVTARARRIRAMLAATAGNRDDRNRWTLRSKGSARGLRPGRERRQHVAAAAARACVASRGRQNGGPRQRTPRFTTRLAAKKTRATQIIKRHPILPWGHPPSILALREPLREPSCVARAGGRDFLLRPARPPETARLIVVPRDPRRTER